MSIQKVDYGWVKTLVLFFAVCPYFTTTCWADKITVSHGSTSTDP